MISHDLGRIWMSPWEIPVCIVMTTHEEFVEEHGGFDIYSRWYSFNPEKLISIQVICFIK